MTKTVVILSGGTGGHVLPSVYFGNHLIEKGYNCILITDKRGSKYTIQFLGKVKIIKASHLTGSLFFKVKGIIKLFLGFVESLTMLFILKPKASISFGSYASLPPSLASRCINIIFKIKFFIHEQNSIMGKTNKFLSKFADKVFVNFETDYSLKKEIFDKTKVVGLPTESKNINHSNNKLLNYSNKNFTIFINGGSQGSLSILSFLEKILYEFSSKELINFYFIIQCPNKYINDFEKKISKFKINYQINDFFYNIPEILKKTDIMISRCGAGTINNIIRFGIPSILIPLPSAKDNHQYLNSLIISNLGCGIIINQSNFDFKKASNYMRQIFSENDKKNVIINKLKNIKILNANKLMFEVIKNEISK